LTPTHMNKNEQIQAAILNIRKEGSRRAMAYSEAMRRHREEQSKRRGERDGRFMAVLLRNIPTMLLLFVIAAWCFNAAWLLLVTVEPSFGAWFTGAVHAAAGILAVCAAILRVAFEYLDINPEILPRKSEAAST